MRLMYISEGNIPSKAANSFQVMKMAEALALQVESLTLVTAGSLLAPQEIDLYQWYGVTPAFRVVKLPVHWRLPRFIQRANRRRFAIAAAMYAKWVKPDLVYTRSCKAARYCVRLGLKTVVENHCEAAVVVRQLSGAGSHADLLGLVTDTEYLKEQYIQSGLSASKLFVWPNAFDLKTFQQQPPSTTVRQQLGLPGDRPVAMYCGHFYEKKGVPCLLEAARMVPEALFCFVGGWPEDIERLRQKAGDRSNIRFLGFVPNQDVPRYLAAADLLVLPNSGRFEHAKATSPLKLFEYMAAKRPILATQIPALEGLLRHGENAWIVPPDSPAELAGGVRTLLGNHEMAKRLAEQAAQEVTQFTWDRRAAEILQFAMTTAPESGAGRGLLRAAS